jgi:hypothetical protein
MVSLYPGQKANEIGKSAQQQHERAVVQLKIEEKATDKLAEKYGQLQLDAMKHTIGRFITFIENLGQRGSTSVESLLEGIEFSVEKIKEYKAATIEVEDFFKGGVKAAGAAAAGYGGAVTIATTIGTASTGTAISSLSGAAATNAMLAWFGGGAVAAGGGGMAVGVWVLGGITAVPALAIGGFIAAREGQKALTKAQEYEAKVNKAIGEINEAKDYSQQIKRRLTELKGLFESINTRAVAGLNKLESQPFDSKKDADAEKFKKVFDLIKALVDIMKTSVLNSEGKLNLGTVTILEKYRNL